MLLEEAERPRPWVFKREFGEVVERVYAGANERERGLDLGVGIGGGRGAGGSASAGQVREGDLLGLGMGVGEEEGGSVMGAGAGNAGSTATMVGSSSGDLNERDFEPVREWFERYKVGGVPSDGGGEDGDEGGGVDRELTGVGTWCGWSEELDGVRILLFIYYLPSIYFLFILTFFTLPIRNRYTHPTPRPPTPKRNQKPTLRSTTRLYTTYPTY